MSSQDRYLLSSLALLPPDGDPDITGDLAVDGDKAEFLLWESF